MSAIEALRKGMDESLFLCFREGCRYLVRGEMKTMLCSHPENRTNAPFKDLPNCYLNACPIYERLEGDSSPFTLFEKYRDRLEALPKSKWKALK